MSIPNTGGIHVMFLIFIQAIYTDNIAWIHSIQWKINWLSNSCTFEWIMLHKELQPKKKTTTIELSKDCDHDSQMKYITHASAVTPFRPYVILLLAFVYMIHISTLSLAPSTKTCVHYILVNKFSQTMNLDKLTQRTFLHK